MVIPFPAAHAARQQAGALLLKIPDIGRVATDQSHGYTLVYHCGNAELAFFTDRQHGDDSRGRYRWSATRFDDTGRPWRTSGFGVMDDFGNLVEVPK